MFFSKKNVRGLIVPACVLVLSGLTACTGRTGSGGGTGSGTSLSFDIAAEITIMGWSGDDKYWTDIGSRDLSPEDLTGGTVAETYAIARAFKQIYPNVKINLFAKIGDNNDENGSWEQHRENFRMEYGIYPDIYTTKDIIGDIQRGLVADLTIFRDDPVFRSINPSLMELMEIEGRIFGIPVYIQPWAVYVNKSLAEANNIDVPDPDWNINEYTRFVSNSRPNEFYGGMGEYWTDALIVRTGTRDFSYQLLNRRPGEPFVNVNSDAVRSLLRYLVQWGSHAIYPNYADGRVSDEFMGDYWWWGYRFFTEGKLLTLTNDPWMMGFLAHPDPEYWAAAKMADWDVYPRPSTDYMGNTVGIVFDPIVIRNYAMDDGNPELNAEEEAKLRIAWEFIKFKCADTRSWEARSRQRYWDGDTLTSALNDSFPIVTGAEFDRQMEIWFSTDTHRRFSDKNKMPGFHYVLDLWKNGQLWDISDTKYPWYTDFEGDRRTIIYEWENANRADVTGAEWHDPNWLDQIYARLPNWNTFFNQRWEAEMRKLEEALNRYYPR